MFLPRTGIDQQVANVIKQESETDAPGNMPADTTPTGIFTNSYKPQRVYNRLLGLRETP